MKVVIHVNLYCPIGAGAIPKFRKLGKSYTIQLELEY